ncbi:23S rRNA (cytosine1962-C5)-methyltransferase [Roseimicrobium gellanilyticum]|uniref:23S rRNA (Cytosine1962-C5)-methyltransferase n=1 Tax=Roseimicrobium gellanilyticum TaxID=748857 RepID=A0A366H0B9_9BACT|nr:class I SAM-dependent rRNA methyltransferase [Roseimicrobium gellanilyticum]RBP35133.1 23S rRNA (cytosine1962-C5)-methyltransferase [Roseimicrobium gellanilyticum]
MQPPRRSPFRQRSAPPGSESWQTPWVQIKYFTFHPNVFPNMVADASPDAQKGDIVAVYDREGQLFGHGFYNKDAKVALRIFQHSSEPLPADHFEQAIRQAVSLRLDSLQLQGKTDAFRVINSDGDGIPGLMVDKFGDVLAVEISTLAAQQRLDTWVPLLHSLLGTKEVVYHFDANAARAEMLSPHFVDAELEKKSAKIEATRITENGVRFHVNFESGHKTGFFCDQRDNRAQLASWVKDARVLDICCYTGGFSVSAMKAGAAEVTAVDLDENAIAVAKKNANLNQQRVSFVHADAFSWMRQMQKNGDTWDAVVLDPPKLVFSRESFEEGKAKYHDMNKLALSLVKRGGLFLTCSCSGLMPVEMFEEIVVGVAHRSGRELQILDRRGAGADHPIMSNCPESRYLKTLWARVW